jgi:hypothetical protein
VTPRQNEGRRSSAGALALVVLVCLLAPAGMPVFAGLIHAAYHSLTTVPAPPHSHAAAPPDHTEGHEHGAPAGQDAGLVHSHLPGGELHSHTVVVDRAIALAGEGPDTAMGPTSSSQQLDRHVPATVTGLPGAPEVASVYPDAAIPLYGHLDSTPPVPPPRG